MDPVTHITAGALGAQVVRRAYEGRFIILFCIIASWLPDIDNSPIDDTRLNVFLSLIPFTHFQWLLFFIFLYGAK